MKNEIKNYPINKWCRQSELAILNVNETSPGIISYEIGCAHFSTSKKSYATTADARKNCIKSYYIKLLNELASLEENHLEDLK